MLNPLVKRLSKLKKKTIFLLVIVGFVLLTIQQITLSKNDNSLNGYLWSYAEMVYPDFSGNGGGSGQNGGSFWEYRVYWKSGNVSIEGSRFLLSNQLSFSKPLPEQTFFPNDTSQIIDPMLIERVKTAKSSTLDITFETFSSIQDTRSLADHYGVDLIWMPFDHGYNIQLGISDEPRKSDAEIRRMFLGLIQTEKYIKGHQDFKEAVYSIFVNDFRIMGFRVVGESDALLKLLNDPLVKTFRFIK